MVPLKHTLKSGDTVEVLTSKNQTPSKDWLNIVKSSRAKSKIKQWLLKLERDKSKEVGKEVLDKAFRVLGSSLKSVIKSKELDEAVKSLSCAQDEERFSHVGVGKIHPKTVVQNIPSLKKYDNDEKKLSEIDQFSETISKTARRKSNKDNAVIVDGMSDLMIRMARCCNPIPGDPIVGYITRGRGITVHTASCNRVDSGELARTIDVEWNSDFAFKHPVNIRVITHDKPGILSQISKAINSIDVNIKGAMAKSLPDRKGSFIFEVEVKDYSELLKTISMIESIEEVISVNRV
jgi:GTP pyrophosphokinase